MVNKRVMIFGLIVLLGLATIKIGSRINQKDMTKLDDEIEIIQSDVNDIELVEDENIRKTVLYFKNSEGYLVPVMRRIPWEEGIAKKTILNMVDSPQLRETLEYTGLIPLIPTGTEVNGMSIDEETGICKVDFSSDLENVETNKDEENLIQGIVYTLTEFPAIKEVQVLVDGKIIPVLKHGTPVGKPIGRENINLMGNIDEGSSKVVVYFKGNSEEDFEYFIPVTIPTLAPMANVYTALDKLFEGPPMGANLVSDLPIGIEFQGVEIKDGTAFVDINFKEQSLLTRDTALNDVIKNIGLTLSEFKEIESVELMVDGQILNTSIPVFANEY